MLQANLGKRPMAQHSLLNDEGLKDYGLLMVSEPACFLNNDGKVVTPPSHHRHWTQFPPTRVATDSRYPIRSLIYVHTDIRAQAVPINSADMTAVQFAVDDRRVLAIAVYVPGNNQVALRKAIALIRETVVRYGPGRELIIAGDFNRHDQLWGGDEVGVRLRQGEAQEIIDMMVDFNLQSLLPRGTKTFEGEQGESTIDLIFTTQGLAEDRLTCQPYHTEHGSDHVAISTTFAIEVATAVRQPRRIFKNANWKHIQTIVARSLGPLPKEIKDDEIDQYSTHLVQSVQVALEQHVPVTKPSPYAKRWWTLDLSQLRREYTQLRNRARSARRWGGRDPALEGLATDARKRFHDTVKRQKECHWDDFLQNADNIWKAAKYLQPDGTGGFHKITCLKIRNRTVEDNKELSTVLLQEFFDGAGQAQMATTEAGSQGLVPLPWQPLTRDEVKDAIFRAQPYKAPGIDGIPAVGWKELWPVVGQWIFLLFEASLRAGRIPETWRQAKILPLRKPSKPDYTVAKAYRPISLLPTLAKALESVVAERLSYLAETYSLLPKNQFGARKRRSTTQALTLLQEKIYEAWRDRKVLSLVSFDVKGAYNGVDRDVLLQRLRQRQVPEVLVRWIEAFCTNRQACITVNGETSDLIDLPQAGLPQGSPLSSILFLFFNADLVQTPITKTQGALAFVDDFNAWVTGPSAGANVERLQTEVIPKVEQWESTSGATFAPEKTALIHFTRAPHRIDDRTPLRIKNTTIDDSSQMKILGVIFDQGLRYHAHAARMTKRGLQAAMALKRLRGLRPSTARQLFTSTVCPTVDYASPVWSINASGRMVRMAEQIQRIAAISIIAGFRTIALRIAEAEASLKPVIDRWADQVRRFWIDLHTLPRTHPFWRIERLIKQTPRRFLSPLQRTAKTFSRFDIKDLEYIEPFCVAPWHPYARVRIYEREKAIKMALDADPERVVYTDASNRNGKIGIGVTSSSTISPMNVIRTIGASSSVSAHHGELVAIQEACLLIDTLWPADDIYPRTTVTIFSDSQSALQALARPRQQSGQSILRDVLHQLQRLSSRWGPRVAFQWLPAHSNIAGNERAHTLAREATEDRQPVPPSVKLKAAAIRESRDHDECGRQRFRASRGGRHAKDLDGALPGAHTRQLYDSLTRPEAQLIAQLRTGKCRLNSYLYRINAVESNLCDLCRVPETVRHFLVECARWTAERAEHIQAATKRWCDVSYILGGWFSERLDGPRHRWKANMEVIKATIKFTRATGRLQVEH